MEASYEVILRPQAEKELNKVPGDIFPKIDRAIRGLGENPRPFGVKKLEDHLHRIRVGDWRIIYAIFDRERQVAILRVTRRSERTYRHLQ